MEETWGPTPGNLSADPKTTPAIKGLLLGEHHQQLAELERCLAHLSLTSRSDSANPTYTSFSLTWPDKFDVNTSNCKGFLLQSSLYFTSHTGLREFQKVYLATHRHSTKAGYNHL